MRLIQAVRSGQRYVYRFDGAESKTPEFENADIPEIETSPFSSHEGSGVIVRVNGALSVIASPTVVGDKIISFVSNNYMYKLINNTYMRTYDFIADDENTFDTSEDEDDDDYEDNELLSWLSETLAPLLKTE